MGIINLRVSLVVFLFALSQALCAQESADTSKTYEWNGRIVKFTRIVKGKTLYSLAKETGVPQDTLIKLNPELETGLKAGMIVRIPAGFVAKDKSSQRAASLTHEVKQGETLYSIGKKYGLTADELVAQNPEAKLALQVGMILKINPKSGGKAPQKVTPENEQSINREVEPSRPSEPEPTSESVACKVSDKTQKKAIRVGLLLPFYTNATELNSKNKIGLEFFSGCKIAIDSLKKAGISTEVIVIDTHADSNAIAGIVNKPELENLDVIIGPLYGSDFKTVSAFANKKGILVVSPFSQNDGIVENLPFACKVTPDQRSQLEGLSRYLIKEKKNARVTLIRNSNVKDQELVNWIGSVFRKESDTSNNRFREIAFTGVNELLSGLDEAYEHVLIFPTTVQVQVIDAIARLSSNRIGKRITLVGLNEWNQYENIEYDHLNNLNFTYASPTFVDFGSQQVKNFQQQFREEFKGEPGNYAFQGFDVSLFFVQSLAQYDSISPECIEKQPLRCGLTSCYGFKKTGSGNGLENNYVNVLQLQDFEAKKLNRP